MHHLIKKQVFSLTLDTGQDAFYVQHKVSNYNQREIIAVLQKIFDEICIDDQVIYIDKLEIDLGNISISEIQNDSWAHLLEESLREKLTKMPTANEKGNLIVYEPGMSGIFRQWLFSMKNGYLPWNAGQINKTWYLKVLEAIASDYKIADELRSVLKGNSTATERIVLQHPVSFLISLTELLTAEKQDKLIYVVEDFFAAVQFLKKWGKEKIIVNKRDVEVTIWKKILTEAALSAITTTGRSRVSTEIMTEKLISTFFSKLQIMQLLKSRNNIAHLSSTLDVFKRVNEQLIAGQSSAGHIIKDELNVVNKPVKENSEGNLLKKSDQAISPGNDFNRDRSKEAEQKLFISDPGKEIKNAPADSGPDTPGETNAISKEKGMNTPVIQGNNLLAGKTKEDREQIITSGNNKTGKSAASIIGDNEIFVQNAGLVLLHPFLNSFFKILGYVKEGKFITPGLHAKALYLMHFLATGNTDPHEHDLVIAKIICAYPLDEPVDSVVELSEMELKEANNLLAAAIASWEILKTTSADGLREGFLQREGKLQVRNQELCLQVETSSIDVLLDHLPWNLSIIKLPWMMEILKVEWR
jgi:hypothetical protein